MIYLSCGSCSKAISVRSARRVVVCRIWPTSADAGEGGLAAGRPHSGVKDAIAGQFFKADYKCSCASGSLQPYQRPVKVRIRLASSDAVSPERLEELSQLSAYMLAIARKSGPITFGRVCSGEARHSLNT